ncbi:ABC transporter substrate-binding protein [Afifella sp. H1R]|uniref:ABC transporter substrate-binding protein n=1 Tax=Afifella sp. H1R TaxID=2908841 RepID=UPI001F3BFE75|nr:ABC transporter substrate-binding protein [Afifella sp. H1R]
MSIVMTRETEMRPHPKALEAQELMARGRLSRRAFIRIAALTGMSAAAAYAVAGLPTPVYAQTIGNVPFQNPDDDPQEGGIIKVGMQVQKMDDPAIYAWTEASNQTRHILEYLTYTTPDNVTHPMLAESWEASDDLTEWTFYLRRGVRWHNGEELVADHIRFNVERWCDPALGSSNLGLASIAAMLEEVESDEKAEGEEAAPKRVKRLREDAVEVVDDHTIRFKLSRPVLSFPEDMYNYPTAIVHPSFKAPFSDNPIGTGPFTLAELVVGQRCILKRVREIGEEPFQYWGGAVFLDEIHYYDVPEETQLTSFASGDIDAIFEFGVEQMELAQALDGNILSTRTAQTLCLRFQVDQEPWTDKRVRQAFVKACDNAAMLPQVFPESGDVGWNHHVSPLHPEYFPLPKLERDVEAAKALLAEAGQESLEVTVACGKTDGPWQQTVCEIVRDQVKEAGITLNINIMATAKYWEIWKDTPFGATQWTHRPLGTMALSLGYRTGVPWNETHYSNPEFDAALDEAETILDAQKRKAAMENVEKILQDDAVMVQPIFRPVYTISSKKVHGYPAHPSQYHQFNKVWIER